MLILITSTNIWSIEVPETNFRNSSCYYGLPCTLSKCEEDDCGLLKVRENQCQQDFDANDENLFREQFVDAFKTCYYLFNLSPTRRAAGYELTETNLTGNIAFSMTHYDRYYTADNFTKSAKAMLLATRSYSSTTTHRLIFSDTNYDHNVVGNEFSVFNFWCRHGRLINFDYGSENGLEGYARFDTSNSTSSADQPEVFFDFLQLSYFEPFCGIW